MSQTLHFHFYFEQSWWNSVRWSFRDWFVWFAIFAVVYHTVATKAVLHHLTLRSATIVALIAIACGFAQTFLIISLDFIAGTASRPFWQDFTHFYSKRWLQHLLIFVIFWLALLRWIALQESPKPADNDDAKIKLSDGKKTYWLSPAEIVFVEAAGNYVCFHHDSDQIIVRGTIKDFEQKLSDHNFLRVSRSSLVNLSRIVASRRVSRNKMELVLSNEAAVGVGKTYWAVVRTKLSL